MGGSGFAVVSTVREFPQIRLIAALIVTTVCVETEKHALTYAHSETVKLSLCPQLITHPSVRVVRVCVCLG